MADCCGLHTHAEMKQDPTQTTGVRKRFSADAYKRFRRLKGRIRDAVVKNDGFGLTTNRGDFDFERSSRKVQSFMDWLAEQERQEGLRVEQGTSIENAAEQAWTATYVRTGYQRGVNSAGKRMRGQGIEIEDDFEEGAFNRPIHADALGIIYTRTYRELQGVTDAMDQQISRELAQGLAEGINPTEMARRINDRVDKIGITRARTLARTEVINANAEATLNSYQEAQVEGVSVQAEFSTAGDARVCPRCEKLEGTVYTIDEARGLIPVHPNCRCALLPVPGGQAGEPEQEREQPEPPQRERVFGSQHDPEILDEMEDSYGTNIPEELSRLIRNSGKLNQVRRQEKGAFFLFPDMMIDMNGKRPKTGSARAVFRHEYGHHLDFSNGYRVDDGETIRGTFYPLSSDAAKDVNEDRKALSRMMKKASGPMPGQSEDGMALAGARTALAEKGEDYAEELDERLRKAGFEPENLKAPLRQLDPVYRDRKFIGEEDLDPSPSAQMLEGIATAAERNRPDMVQSTFDRDLYVILRDNYKRGDGLDPEKLNELGESNVQLADYLESVSNAKMGFGHGAAYLKKGNRVMKRDGTLIKNVQTPQTKESFANFISMKGMDEPYASLFQEVARWLAPRTWRKYEQLIEEAGADE